MRILHVVPTYLPATRYGGPIYSVHGLCKALVARGHEVHVFTTNVDGLGVSDVVVGKAVDLDGVKVWYFPSTFGRRLFFSPAMARAIERDLGGFDILHCHYVYSWPPSFAAWWARRLRVPYVLSPRGMLVDDLIRKKNRLIKTAWIELFERANIAGAATLHVTTGLEAKELRKLGFTLGCIDIIPNGIDAPGEGISNPYDRTPAPRILSLGRISWKKGLDRLIAAMVHVPTAELIIAGNDEEQYLDYLEACTKKCGVAHRVIFNGPVYGEAKWKLIRSCDVFAMPSYSENFGNVALEAMACGRPVIVTPEVGLAATISQIGAGLVVDGDPEAFGKALADLLSDDARRQRMGALGASAAASSFSWRGIAEQMEAVYLRKRRGTCEGKCSETE